MSTESKINISKTLDTSHLKVKFPFKEKYGNFIGGKFVKPKSGKYFDNVSPINNEVICSVARSDASDLATEHITSLLIGLTLSKYLPDFGLTNFPPIKFPYFSLKGNLTFKWDVSNVFEIFIFDSVLIFSSPLEVMILII